MMRTDWMMSTAILRVVMDDEDRLDDEYSNTENGGGG
jgi:hypothetical protein